MTKPAEQDRVHSLLKVVHRIAARENAFHGELRMIVNDPELGEHDKIEAIRRLMDEASTKIE